MAGEPVQRRLQFVLEHFGKRPTKNVILNYFGMANEVYTIETKDSRYVVKNCFKNNSHELASNEAALIRHLNEHHVPSPKLVPTKAGKEFLEYDGHFYIMTEYVSGYTMTWEAPLTEVLAKETIRALAEYHTATESFEPPYDVDPIKSFDIDRIKTWLRGLKEELQTADETRVSVSKMKVVVDQLETLAASLEQKLETADISSLKQVFIHGDFHCFNMIFNEEETQYKSIVDFDFSRIDYRMVDFLWSSRSMIGAYFFPLLYGRRLDIKENPPTPEQFSEVTRVAMKFMIDEYRRYAELPDEEIKLLPLFTMALPLFTARFFKLSNSEEECLAHAEWFSFQLNHLAKSVDDLENAIACYFNEQAGQ
jgi:Ser/Thr protein kinase RdoA (MazF antagonist)